MPPHSAHKQAFSIAIDGTSFTAHIREADNILQINVEGTDADKRGRAALNMLGDKLRKDGYNPSLKNNTAGDQLHSELSLTHIDATERIHPENIAFEVLPYLRQMKELADTKGPFTGEPLGFDDALKIMREPLNWVEFTRPPGKKKEYSVKFLMPVEDLRAAINAGLHASAIENKLPDGASALSIVSGAIMDALIEAQDAKPKHERWGTSAPMSDREVTSAIGKGIMAGLKRVNTPKDLDKDLKVDAREEIFKAIRRAEKQSREGGGPGKG